MRSISEYVPDVQIRAPGAPQFMVLHALASAVAEFLSRTEAWKEWAHPADPEDIEDGVFVWENYLDPEDANIDDYQWLAVKRVEMIQWGAENCVLRPRVASKLASHDREWRTRTGIPYCFVQEGHEGGSVRFVPVPDNVTLPDTMVARLVVTTEVTNGLQTSELNTQIPQLPENLFYRYRNAIIDGALAYMYDIPNRDWSDPVRAREKRGAFEDTIIRAASESARDYSHAPVVTEMDPYWR